ncbi:MAG: hemolysin family protein [Caldilineaceae bacterium]
MTVLVIIAVIAFLIAVNGLYVAAEFSAVSARRPRLAQMADDGDHLAQVMLNIVEDPRRLDAYVAACQLGITVSSLVLGFYGQSRIMALLQPWLESMGPSVQTLFQAFGATAILLFLTVIQVVLGELVPKNIGVQYPEKLSTLTARPMLWSMRVYRPLIWIFNGSGQILLRLMGAHAVAEHAHVHSPEEILMLVEESGAGGILDTEERRLLVNTLQLRDLNARKVMIPRNRMLVGSVDGTCGALLRRLANSPYSRMPIYDGSIDNIIGVVHLKDLMRVYYQRHGQSTPGADEPVPDDGWSVRSVMHPVAHVPESVEVGEVLTQMQRAHYNLVIVVDEYGGTAGMVTIEDLVEEIIGEFEDEFDAENPPLAVGEDGRIYVRGDVLVEDINDALEIALPVDGVDTIGGLMLSKAGKIPAVGDKVLVGSIEFRIEKVVRNGVTAVSFPADEELLARAQPAAEEF